MKMTQEELIRFLDAESDDAKPHHDGRDEDRTKAIRAYLRKPYGTEQEGRSQVVASDVFDAVEGMLPDIVEVFVSSDKAVVFDPVSQEDEQGAEQATNACNHVFYKQNNGFLALYTAAKDALMLRTGGLKWYWDVRRTPDWTTYRAVDEMQLAAFLVANPNAEVVSKEEYDPNEQEQAQIQQAMAMGMPVPQRFTVRIKTVKERGTVKIVPIPPDEIEVSRRHNSILLDECPYVAHVRECTLSDVRQMGYRVEIEDIKAARHDEVETDYRDQFRDWHRHDDNDLEDSMVRGWLREEYVLVDFDGDGIAERRKVVRLGRKVLENIEFSHVPIAAWTPYILTHRFQGISVFDLVEDFQRVRTEIWRNQLDNLDLANNQETVVLTDPQGNPLANIDDLLNRRPGGILRERSAGAIRPYVERWQGIEANPMLQALEQAKQNRTGFIPTIEGLDADALNKTATQVSKEANRNQKRMKMMARIMAECLVAPTFRGIFKTLTDYCMEKLSFRLNGSFVAYDPQEWRDQYDMTINVGIGTGDQVQQGLMLQMMAQSQLALMASPMAPLVSPQNVFNVQSRMAENAGFKNPGEFFTDPKTAPPAPPPPPDPKVQLEQMKLQADAQKFQAEMQMDAQKFKAETQMKMAVDQNRQKWEAEQKALEIEQEAKLEALKAQYAEAARIEEARYAERARMEELNFQKWKAELDAVIKLAVADKGSEQESAAEEASDNKIGELARYITAPTRVVRDEMGEIVGVEKAGALRPLIRDEMGRPAGLG